MYDFDSKQNAMSSVCIVGAVCDVCVDFLFVGLLQGRLSI